MVKVLFDKYENSFILTRDTKINKNYDDLTINDLITIPKIKEVIQSIKILFNDPGIEIIANGGCIDVLPINHNEKIDAPIFNNFKIEKINNNTLELFIDDKLYKTKKINSDYKYQGKTYYTNVLDSIEFKIITG